MQEKQFEMKVHVYKSPIAALLWSLLLPGFGQIYVRDYLIGFILIAWEIAVNVLGNINWSIYFSFTGELAKSGDIVNVGWGLFYPSVYAFNAWHAYNRAREINEQLQRKGVSPPEKKAYYTGMFIGLGLGMFFGVHWRIFISPVFSGLSLGIAGAITGNIIEKILFTKMNINKRSS